MIRAQYINALTRVVVADLKFNTEEEFLNHFYAYMNIAPGARASWVGCTDSLFADGDDYSDKVSVDLGRDLWLILDLI